MKTAHVTGNSHNNALDMEERLRRKAQWVRSTVLEMAVKAHSGHVSTAFSQTELLVALYYGGLLRFDARNPKWNGRDRFILSKGQGGIGLYPILADQGYFPLSELENFAGVGNLLGVHAEWNIPGIEVITGSLGHGLPIATGMAEAALMNRDEHLIVCFLGDAELFEGSNWEAAIYAGHRGYRNLICIVDRNGQGVLGPTDPADQRLASDNPRLNPLDKKFKAFGFETREIDGHSFPAIFEAFGDMRSTKRKKPLMIIANTRKGHGASLMEGKRLWHYRVPEGADLELTRHDINHV
ncbi:MAG: transketolase [Nitrospira sp.]|nr:transketolase [Nitrospira sp.]